jgi:hypothetical protein
MYWQKREFGRWSSSGDLLEKISQPPSSAAKKIWIQKSDDRWRKMGIPLYLVRAAVVFVRGPPAQGSRVVLSLARSAAASAPDNQMDLAARAVYSK